MPVVVVGWLHGAGIVTSPWLCIALAIALSFTASALGSAYWQRCSRSGDVFFSELLVWGWLHRFRSERRLARTMGLLGLDGLDGQAALGDESLEQKARVLRQMAAALDAQDPYTDGHSRRVALHSAMVARKMGIDREDVTKLRTAAAVHDIGKLQIPPELLNKPEKLTESEFEIVKRHADEGAEIVACMAEPEITEMVRHHHERFDGAGYPSGLLAEQIPLGARIIAVADTFDALTSVRPYRKAISHKRALETIAVASGTQLDPVVVRAFLRCYSSNRAVVFWTLLAVSPARAVSWIRGKAPGPANLASSATVTLPAALAAVAVTAFGNVSGAAASHSPLQLAQRTSVQSAGGAKDPKHQLKHASNQSGGATGAASPQKVAVLGVQRTRGALARHSSRDGGTTGGSGGSSSPGGSSGGKSGSDGGSAGGTTGGSGGGKRGGSGGGHGAPPTSPPAGTTSSPVSGISASPTAPTTSTDPASTVTTSAGSSGANGGTTTSSGGSTGANPGGGGSTGSGGGSGSGSQGGSGNGQGGSGNGQGGSGNGGGGAGGTGSGSGSPQPLTKDDCKNGGWALYGLPNQGQCVALVEHQLHP
jgi:putative nucleotidyltransferase with HDIG domain